MNINSSGFYNKLLELYFVLKIPSIYEELGIVGKKISWYLADEKQLYVSCMNSTNKNIIEIDIKSAYPSICRCLFDINSEFIQTMNGINDKDKRNIYISTTLESNYLKDLALISKLIIFGVIMENYSDNITILEIKKDSCLIICNNDHKQYLDSICFSNLPFTSFIINNNFKFNINNYNSYYRSNKTSVFLSNSKNIIIKGQFKYCPQFIQMQLTQILINNIIEEDKLIKIYSKQFHDIIIKNHINELIDKYYICENKQILTNSYTYKKFNEDKIDPYAYLKLFIYPAILSLKVS